MIDFWPLIVPIKHSKLLCTRSRMQRQSQVRLKGSLLGLDSKNKVSNSQAVGRRKRDQKGCKEESKAKETQNSGWMLISTIDDLTIVNCCWTSMKVTDQEQVCRQVVIRWQRRGEARKAFYPYS